MFTNKSFNRLSFVSITCDNAHLPGAVSWGKYLIVVDIHVCVLYFQQSINNIYSFLIGGHNKSLDVFVLIKTKETWTCQNTKCPYLGLGEGGYPIPLLDEDGDFLDKCTFCGIGAKRCGRVRKPTRKAI